MTKHNRLALYFTLYLVDACRVTVRRIDGSSKIHELICCQTQKIGNKTRVAFLCMQIFFALSSSAFDEMHTCKSTDLKMIRAAWLRFKTGDKKPTCYGWDSPKFDWWIVRLTAKIKYRWTHFIMTSFLMFDDGGFFIVFLSSCNHKMIDAILFQKCLIALTQCIQSGCIV